MTLNRELIERVAKSVGKTLEDFDKEVADLKSKSPIAAVSQDMASVGEVVTFLIVNAEMMAQMNAELMGMVFESQMRILELEEKTNA